MPTVLRMAGFRVAIYMQDHRPSHVHVLRDVQEAVFNLRCSTGTLKLREQTGFREHEINKLEHVLEAHVEELCEAWRRIHGDA